MYALTTASSGSNYLRICLWLLVLLQLCVAQKYLSYSSATIDVFAGKTYTSGYNGENLAATLTSLYGPYGIPMGDTAGNIYIADLFNNRIRRVSGLTNQVTTYAGNGQNTFSGDGNTATSASINQPHFVWLNTLGDVFIADYENSRIRKVVKATGIITTVTGGGGSYVGNITATSASLTSPRGIWGDTNGVLYVTDTMNYQIKRIATNGILTIYAGTGSAVFGGDGGPASSASFLSPFVSWGNTAGTLYIVDYNDHSVREIDEFGIINTLIGDGTSGYDGDGGPAQSAHLYNPTSVFVDQYGNLFIGDQKNCRIRMIIMSTNIVSTLAGTSLCSNTGNGYALSSASLAHPAGAWVDSNDDIYITDHDSHTIRKITFVVGTSGSGSGSGVTPTISPSPALTPSWADTTFAPSWASPTVTPSGWVNTYPTAAPTLTDNTFYAYPTVSPSVGVVVPSVKPTAKPTWKPTTIAPSRIPTRIPTAQPTRIPTALPTRIPTFFPSSRPSSRPSSQPTEQPVLRPTAKPSYTPVAVPTSQPSSSPTSHPTAQPTSQPSGQPILRPTSFPTAQPSVYPTAQPTLNPSSKPTSQPSSQPTSQPTQPTSVPSSAPSTQPFSSPTSKPSSRPSRKPTSQPSSSPSQQPIGKPTSQPSTSPTLQPSGSPTAYPSTLPTSQPSQVPTSAPSAIPPCPAGTRIVWNATQDNGYMCQPCGAGYTSLEKSQNCTLCPAGSFAANAVSPECTLCLFNSYQPDAGQPMCIKCAYGEITSQAGSTALGQCVNPSTNFIMGGMTLAFVFIASWFYIINGRLLKIAYSRRNMLITRGMQLFGITLFISEILTITNHSLTIFRFRMGAGRTDDALAFSRNVRVVFFYVAAALSVPAMIVIKIFSYIVRILFNAMIIWRGYELYFEIPNVLVDGIDSFLELVDEVLGFSLFKHLAYPVKAFINAISNIKINLRTVSVTCVGAQGPFYLLINICIAGLVIIVVKSDFQVFWTTCITSLCQKTLLSSFHRYYTKKFFRPVALQCTLALSILLFPMPHKIIQYALGFVTAWKFFESHGISASDANCDAAMSMPVDTILAIATTICCLLIFLPIVFMLAQILVPSFERQYLTDIPIISKFTSSKKFKKKKKPLKKYQVSNSRVVQPSDLPPDTEAQVMEVELDTYAVTASKYPASDNNLDTEDEEEDGEEVIDKNSLYYRIKERVNHGYSLCVQGLQIILAFTALDHFYAKMLCSYAQFVCKTQREFILELSKEDIQSHMHDSAKEKKLFMALDNDSPVGRGGKMMSKRNMSKLTHSQNEDRIAVIDVIEKYKETLKLNEYDLPQIPMLLITPTEVSAGTDLQINQGDTNPSYVQFIDNLYIDTINQSSSSKRFEYFFKLSAFLCWPFQLLTNYGWSIWLRVMRNYCTLGMISLGIWTDEVVKDFHILEEYKEFEKLTTLVVPEIIIEHEEEDTDDSDNEHDVEVSRTMLKKKVSMTTSVRQLSSFTQSALPMGMHASSASFLQRNSMNHHITTSAPSQEQEEAQRKLDFLEYLASQVAVRVVLIQLIPMFTIWSIFAVELATCPVFIWSKDLNERLPPLYISDPLQSAKKRLISMSPGQRIPPPWKLYSLAAYLFLTESRLIQFIITVLSTATAMILIFAPKELLHIVVYFLIAILVIVGAVTGLYISLMLHRFMFPEDNEDLGPKDKHHNSTGRHRRKSFSATRSSGGNIHIPEEVLRNNSDEDSDDNDAGRVLYPILNTEVEILEQVLEGDEEEEEAVTTKVSHKPTPGMYVKNNAQVVPLEIDNDDSGASNGPEDQYLAVRSVGECSDEE